jgi:hypothetical protein
MVGWVCVLLLILCRADVSTADTAPSPDAPASSATRLGASIGKLWQLFAPTSTSLARPPPPPPPEAATTAATAAAADAPPGGDAQQQLARKERRQQRRQRQEEKEQQQLLQLQGQQPPPPPPPPSKQNQKRPQQQQQQQQQESKQKQKLQQRQPAKKVPPPPPPPASSAARPAPPQRPVVTAASGPLVLVSPSNGTDVLTHPIAVIKCNNQTRCIQPKLQLRGSYDVYLCKHIGQGVRFFFLAKEGLLLHPNIRLVATPEAAAVVVYLPVSAPWHKSECNKPEFKEKTIILDEGDYPQLFEQPGPGEWLLYFKRSYVRRHDGAFKGYMGYLDNPAVLPMTYPVAEAYVRPQFNMMRGRDLDIVCTLRGSASDPTRLRVRQWVDEYAKARGVKKVVAGQVNHASRTVVDTSYLGQMFRAKLIVTSNPSDWEGDFRLMEAYASGALIVVDRMYVPRPYPLLEGKHVVYYDNSNKTDLFEKLDVYRTQMEKARRIAVAGYLHAMKHHRAANLMDFVFRTLETKRAALKLLRAKAGDATAAAVKLPSDMSKLLESLATRASATAQGHAHAYTETGYHVRQQALEIRRKTIEREKREKEKEKAGKGKGRAPV